MFMVEVMPWVEDMPIICAIIGQFPMFILMPVVEVMPCVEDRPIICLIIGQLPMLMVMVIGIVIFMFMPMSMFLVGAALD